VNYVFRFPIKFLDSDEVFTDCDDFIDESTQALQILDFDGELVS
jgi:hypothetical protein